MGKMVTRREFVAGCGWATAGVLLDSRGARAQSAPVISTEAGRLQGVMTDGVWSYRGVPFARPPVGALRFRAPVRNDAWAGVRRAEEFAPAAMQDGGGQRGNSEDCLYLNVSVPEGKGPFPVYVWIHGGANVGGNSRDQAREGIRFAQDGVVMVTIAYRLGVFGFMDMEPLLGREYAGSQNNGIRDMVLALEWVQRNIEAFGGDAGRVTIGGESAGAKAVAALMSVPEAEQLFHAVISESGGGITVLSEAQGRAVAKEYGAEAKASGLGDLRSADAGRIIGVQTEFVRRWRGDFPFRPGVDGIFLKKKPVEMIAGGAGRGKRLLMGTNRDESALFLQGGLLTRPLTQQSLANVTLEQFQRVFPRYRELYPEMSEGQLRIRAVTAEEYWVPSVRMADAHARAGGETWMYRFDYPAASGPLKGEAFHSEEIRFAFGVKDPQGDAAKARLTEAIHTAWVAFVKGKAPAGSELPAWRKYDVEHRPTMVLNVESRMEERPMEKELRLWDGVL